jgi:CBS domain containing-hemolysin-like protein
VNIRTVLGEDRLLEDGVPILSIILNLLLVLVLVLLNAFFVASEFAFVRVRSSRLAELEAAGNARAKLARHISGHLDAYLSACQLGITLASLGLGWVGEPAIAHLIVEPILGYFHAPDYLITPISFAIAFAVITFLHIVLGELAPKSLAIFKAEGVSLWLGGPLMLFYKIMYPFIWLLNGTANGMLRWFGIRPAGEGGAAHTEEEIRILIKESQKSGHIDKEEMQLVENVFDFSERVAREVMIPRTMMTCLYTNMTFQECLDVVKQHRHTRYPVADGDKDHIIGLVHVTDLYEAAMARSGRAEELRALVRPIPIIPESAEVSQVLRVMQQNKAQMAVVADEYGGTAGLITMEDLIEEIVGDIQDEFRPERPDIEIVNGRTSLEGLVLIEKVNELFGLDIDDEEVDTIAGWMFSQLAEPPRLGSKVTYNNIVFEVTEMDHLRIQRVDVHALPKTSDASDEAEDLDEAVS